MTDPPFFFDPDEVVEKEKVRRIKKVGDPCLLCGLYKTCKSPKMELSGRCEMGILLVGEGPGAEEDKIGEAFVGSSGDYAEEVFDSQGINMNVACGKSNVLQCRPPDNVFLPDKVEFCYDRLENQIKKLKPKLIICFGKKAAYRIIENKIVPGLSYKDEGGAYSNVQGDIYPIRKYGAWALCSFHPAYILRKRADLRDVFYAGIEKGLAYLDIPLPEPLIDTGQNIWYDSDNEGAAIELLHKLSVGKKAVSIDYEASQLSTYTGTPEMYVVSLAISPDLSHVINLQNASHKLKAAWKEFLRSPVPKIGQGNKFENHWSKWGYNTYPKNWVWDTMTVAHLLDEKPRKTNLAYLVFQETGEAYKNVMDLKNKKFISYSLKTRVKYSGLDSRFPLLIYDRQRKRVEENGQQAAVKYLRDCTGALTLVERRGVQIDMDAFEDYSKEVTDKRNKAYGVIAAHFGFQSYVANKGKLNLRSDAQLADFLFTHLHIKPVSFTEHDNPQVNKLFFKSALSDPQLAEHHAMLESLSLWKSLEKMTSNFLKSVLENLDENNILHPTINVHLAGTQRTSCDTPNLQNIPVRNEELRRFRRIFVPNNDTFLEPDYAGAELVVAAHVAQDQNMLEDIKNKVDIHLNYAEKLWELSRGAAKEHRQDSKNGFVFPELYGSYFRTIARNLGLDEEHVKAVEAAFFERYLETLKFQEWCLDDYDKKLYVDLPLGFRRHAPLSDNQIINTHIQGPTCFCMMDGLSKIVKAFMKYKLKSFPVLQVHDSILIDTKSNEESDIIEITEEAMINKDHWDWARGIPFSIDWKEGPNWYEMEDR